MRNHTCTEQSFKNYRPDDLIFIEGKDGSSKKVYFKFVFAGRLSYKDMNSNEYSVEVSELSDTYQIS